MATLKNLIFMELELKHGLTAKEVVEIFMAFLTRLRTILGTIHILRDRFLGKGRSKQCPNDDIKCYQIYQMS